MRENFFKKINNEEKNVNQQIFREYFNYQSPSFPLKDLYEYNKNDNYITIKYLNESLINLRTIFNKKGIPKNENPKKVVNIFGKILDYNKHQKGKGLHSD